MGTEGCVLCGIISGKLSVDRIVESTHVIGFMNEIEALSRGHAVFFPKRHVPSLHQVEDAVLAEMLVLVKRVAVALGMPPYNVLVNTGSLAGQTVFHAHMHLIPKWSDDDGLRHAHLGRRMNQSDVARLVRERLETDGDEIASPKA